jgi:polysaccharide biosynthesis/export protein
MKAVLKIGFMSFCMTAFFLVGGTVYSSTQLPGDKDYIIGSGDVLQVQVWDHDDLNRSVEVAQDGTFSFPFIGKVSASGKSLFMLEKHIEQKLSEGYLVGPQVTVGITEYKNKKAFLFGEINRPGSYILKPNMHLLELVSDAGGFTKNRGMTCTIIRASNPNQNAQPVAIEDASEHEVITVNLTQLTAGNYQENQLIKPNDTIYISKTEHIFVTGEVKTPGEVEYAEGMTVRQAIAMAGGGTPKASLKRTRITRMNNGKEIEIKPNLGDTISPNDIIKVPESYF